MDKEQVTTPTDDATIIKRWQNLTVYQQRTIRQWFEDEGVASDPTVLSFALYEDGDISHCTTPLRYKLKNGREVL